MEAADYHTNFPDTVPRNQQPHHGYSEAFEAESLTNLQATFDAYIESSRKLETEWNVEYERIHHQLEESRALNSKLQEQIHMMERERLETKQAMEDQQAAYREMEASLQDTECRAKHAESQLHKLREFVQVELFGPLSPARSP